MVEVASSNLAGPTKFLSLCFSENLFFFFAESSRAMASYLYPGKVVINIAATPAPDNAMPSAKPRWRSKTLLMARV